MTHDEPTNQKDIAQRVLPLIDLTLLGDADTREAVEALCDAAHTPHGNVAAVCVWPEFVETAIARLDGTGIDVAAVSNFPDGSLDVTRAVDESKAIVASGGREVDVVFPWRALVEGRTGVGADLVTRVRDALPDSVVLKVILETGEIHDPALIKQAALEAIEGGADFLKTSTGKSPTSATPEAARVLFETAMAAPRPVGVKISGGVRSVDDAKVYLDLADEHFGRDRVESSSMRIGASSLLDDVLDALGGTFDQV